MKAKPNSREFYYNEKHRMQDADLHNAILRDGDDAKARAVSKKVAKELGLTEQEIAALFPAK